MGGLEQAIEQSAEKAFAESGISEEACRQLFVQLVDVAQDAQPTRRVAKIAHPNDDTEAAISAFAAHRLLTTDYDTVSISHEVLLSAWPRLVTWVDDGRVALVAVNRLRSAAKLWDQVGRDRDTLLRGGQLCAAEEVAANPNSNARLSELDHQFLAACQLAATEQLAEERRQLSRRMSSQANLLFDKSANLSAQIALAAHETTATTESRSAIIRATSPLPGSRHLCGPGPAVLATALGQATVAFSKPDKPHIHVIKLPTTGHDQAQALPKPSNQPHTTALAITSNGDLVAHGSADGTIHLLDIAVPGQPVMFDTDVVLDTDHVLDGPINALLFSQRAGHVFATGGNGGTACWNLKDRQDPQPCGMIPTPGTTLSLSIGTVRLWILDGQRPAPQVVLADTAVPTMGGAAGVEPPAVNLAFSSCFRLLAVTSESGNTTIFDVSSPAKLQTLARFRSGSSFAHEVAFHPSRPTLAVGNADQSTSLWDLGQPSDPQLLAHLPGATGNTMAVAFNTNGNLLAVGTTSGMVSIWDTTMVSEPVLFAQFRSTERGVYALAFAPGQQILTGSGPNQSLFHWTIDEDAAVSLIQGAVGDPLTMVERRQHLPEHESQ